MWTLIADAAVSQAPAAEPSPWYFEVLKQGGLAAVIIVLALIIRYLLAKANKSDTQAVDERVKSDNREDRKLEGQKETNDDIVAEKNKEIASLKQNQESIEKCFRDDLKKFLAENIDARHDTSDAIREMKKDIGDQLRQLINKDYYKRG